MTRPLARSHLASPAAMNWSMIALRTVGEIAELRFPQDERLGVRKRIAIFEAEHAELTEAALSRTSKRPPPSTWHSGNIFLPRLLIDPDRVALAEGPAAAVLPREPNALPFRDQASEGERLRRRPVEAPAALEHRLLGVEDALEGLVDVDALGNGGQDLAEVSELIRPNRRVDVAAAEHRLVRAGTAPPAPLEPVRLVRAVGFGGVELFLDARQTPMRRSTHAWSTTPSDSSRFA